MNIKLISPAVTMRPMDSLWKTRMAPPMSLAVLAALTPRQHAVSIADENVERMDMTDAPDLVGLTVKVDTVERAKAITLAYRRRGIPVVWGGIHPTVCPDDCGRYTDAVVVGEAEQLWPQVLEDAASGTLRNIYRNAGPVPVSSSPVPRWDLFKESRYLFTNTVTIGRGCPWRCDFCYNSSPNIDAAYRMKPVPRILGEIEALGTDHVMFIDDNFIGDPAGIRGLLPELRKLRLTWHAAVSADIGRHDDILDAMAETGCKSLFIGFETVNQRNLMACHKAQNRTERYDELIRKIHMRGMLVNASVVVGFDGDDPGVFPATLEWLVANRVASMTAHILTPYPGTRLHDRLEREGRIIDRNLERYNTAHAVFRPANMSPAELEAGYRWIYSEFYSWANILRRWPSGRGQHTSYLMFNLFYRKFGKPLSRIGGIVGMRRLAEFSRRLAFGHRAARYPKGKPAPGVCMRPLDPCRISVD